MSPTVLEIPADFIAEDIIAWEELDGYPHKLDRKECFLLSLLEQRKLDAVVSFHAKIVSAKIAPLVKTEDEFWLHYQRTGIYPVNHIFVLRKELSPQFPHLVEALLAGLREARNDWVRYLDDGEREAMEKEIERLGWDPFAYRLTEVERKTLEAFITYLAEEKLISERLSCDELFSDASLAYPGAEK
jgi:4,5-dihydroxyphthalate decarboxylase